MIGPLGGIVVIAPENNVAIGQNGGQCGIVGDLKFGQEQGIVAQIVTAQIQNTAGIVNLQPVVIFKKLVHLVVGVGGDNLIDKKRLPMRP